MNTSTLSIGDVIELTGDRIAYGGEVVGRYDGLVVFVPLGAPGDKLRVRITERKKSYARGVIEDILTGSQVRRCPACQYFGRCGGCQLQHIDYAAQLEAKSNFISEALKRVAGLDWPQRVEVCAAAEFGYRARAELKAERTPQGEIRVGFNQLKSRSVCDVESCPVLMPALDGALSAIRQSIRGSSIWEQGDSRTASFEIAADESGVACEPKLADFESGPLTRTVAGATYRFSPSTFFQANSLLIDDLVREVTGDASGDRAIDLYCGVGLFTVPLARQFAHVVGVESNPDAARFARENAVSNSAANIEVWTEHVDRWLARAKGQDQPRPDLVLLNPPRTGAAETIRQIASLDAARVTYVSCDPTTLARDLAVLCESGYRLDGVTGFDLFPQTYHVETVAKLVRIS
jgi:23S rRNA (uracil1939-C5)-methyltransferase